MASQNESKLNRKLPPGWERRIDFATNRPYYVDHSNEKTQWNPPPPKSPIPPTPPNNLNKPNPLQNNNYSNIFKFPTQPRKRHAKSSTIGDNSLSAALNLFKMNSIKHSPALPTLNDDDPFKSINNNNNDNNNKIKSRPLPLPMIPRPLHATTDTIDDKYQNGQHIRRMSSHPLTKPKPPPKPTQNESMNSRLNKRNKFQIKRPPTYRLKYGNNNNKNKNKNNDFIPPPPPRTPPQSTSHTTFSPKPPPSPSNGNKAPFSNHNNNNNQQPQRAPFMSSIPPPARKKAINRIKTPNHNNSALSPAVSLSLNKSNTPRDAHNNKHSGYISPAPSPNTSPHSNEIWDNNEQKQQPNMKHAVSASVGSAHNKHITSIKIDDSSSGKWKLKIGRNHASTATSPSWAGGKVNFKSTYHKLQQKYDKKKKKLKEKQEKKKGKKNSLSLVKKRTKSQATKPSLSVKKRTKFKFSLGAEPSDYDKRKEDNLDISNSNSGSLDDEKEGDHLDIDNIEYSISGSTSQSITVSSTSNGKFKTNNTFQNKIKKIERIDEAPDLRTLEDIVSLVTSATVRGTQDQTVLLYTYSIYSSRPELLHIVLKRLNDISSDPMARIKVLSLLRTWLKTENDFADIAFDEDDYNVNKPQIVKYQDFLTSNNKGQPIPSSPSLFISTTSATKSDNSILGNKDKLRSLSPVHSAPQPELDDAYDLQEHKLDLDTESLNKVANDDDNDCLPSPSLKKINNSSHVTKYSDDLINLPPHIILSGFASYFRKELILQTQHNLQLIKLSKPILKQFMVSSNDNTNFKSLRNRTLSLADAPKSKIPKQLTAKDIELHKLSSKEVARQICLCEYEIFKQIKYEEFLKQKSTKEKKAEKAAMLLKLKTNSTHNVSSEVLQKNLMKMKADNELNQYNNSHQPNIDRMVDWFNKLVAWVQIEILSIHDLKKRTKTMARILKICSALEMYNNISSLLAIRTGLCSAPIHRLKKTWANLPKKARETSAKLDILFKLGNGQKNLRDRVAIISQPAIPHLALFLADIVFIHDGNDTFKKDKINWSKMKLLADRINWISMFQQSPFIFHTVDIIVQYLESRMKIVPEEFLFKLSREVEKSQKKK